MKEAVRRNRRNEEMVTIVNRRVSFDGGVDDIEDVMLKTETRFRWGGARQDEVKS